MRALMFETTRFDRFGFYAVLYTVGIASAACLALPFLIWFGGSHGRDFHMDPLSDWLVTITLPLAGISLMIGLLAAFIKEEPKASPTAAGMVAWLGATTTAIAIALM